ncbi:MAG TPA: NAD(P)/FAD-dependent oxidoreductase [Candidatus Elarobacter sp.]|jgi:monoamine oxidase|nr:NAD(P)/FAD-dependent oxidoreductase [Candidatus Elarobacter sp.]
MNLRCDVVVLGAGAAGLAAARLLSEARAHVVVLEARDRVGGRILTREDVGLQVPIDLGGEFVHGTSATSFALLRAANTVAVDLGERAFSYEDGELRDRDDPFEVVARVLARANELRDDVSIDQFLRDLPDGEDVERARRYTRMLIEGFDAADPALASTIALAAEWNGGPGGQTAEQFRPLGGYAPLLRRLCGALDPERVQVRLATPAHVLRRDDEGVLVEATTSFGEPLHVRARKAIVTLPVGVLHGDGLRFDPELPPRTRDALARLIMGPVVKLVLRFRTAYWERVQGGRYRDGGFFHNAAAAFPTFWTMMPLRAPLLVGWAGGPKAAALAGRGEPELVATALADLRTLFGGEIDPGEELEAAYLHDWQRDPWSRGAYSYVAVGAGDPRADLAAPVDDVIYFAGEATAGANEAGTVAGALITGERAAREALS